MFQASISPHNVLLQTAQHEIDSMAKQTREGIENKE